GPGRSGYAACTGPRMMSPDEKSAVISLTRFTSHQSTDRLTCGMGVSTTPPVKLRDLSGRSVGSPTATADADPVPQSLGRLVNGQRASSEGAVEKNVTPELPRSPGPGARNPLAYVPRIMICCSGCHFSPTLGVEALPTSA